MSKRALFFVSLLLLVAVAMGLYEQDIPLVKLKEKYANEYSQFLPIAGIDVHYRIEGEGPPLLLIHGTGSSLHTWDDWVDTLKNQFQTIRLDLPAYGLTGPSKDGNYTYQYYADFINDFLNAIQVQSCHVAGNSLGGGIAWTLALSYPERVDKLVLVNASGFPKKGSSPWIFRLARSPIFGPFLKNITPRFIFQSNLEAVYFQDEKIEPALIDRYFELSRRPGNRDAFIARSKVKNVDRTDHLNQIKNETLIIWGRHDEWIPVEDAQKFDAALPNSQVILYDNAGHVPMEEIPFQSANDVKRFLDQKKSLKTP